MTQQEQLKENLVLVGSTNYEYVESLRAFIQNKQFVWSSWNFRIREEWRNVISERVKSNGKFPIFFYLSKKMGGSGLVEFVGVVSDIRMSDTPTKPQTPISQTPVRRIFRQKTSNHIHGLNSQRLIQ